MGDNGLKKTTIIVIVVIVIIAIIALYFGIFKKDAKTEYNLTTANSAAENTLFKDYASFNKFISKVSGLDDTMVNKVTFKKSSLSETYTEEFFKENKLALVAVYEDTSKDYMYAIDKVEYNSDKTQATITYTYKYGTFADVLSKTWYDYMFVELEDTVESVIFQRASTATEK